MRFYYDDKNIWSGCDDDTSWFCFLQVMNSICDYLTTNIHVGVGGLRN